MPGASASYLLDGTEAQNVPCHADASPMPLCVRDEIPALSQPAALGSLSTIDRLLPRWPLSVLSGRARGLLEQSTTGEGPGTAPRPVVSQAPGRRRTTSACPGMSALIAPQMLPFSRTVMAARMGCPETTSSQWPVQTLQEWTEPPVTCPVSTASQLASSIWAAY